jgi:glycolate oxidase FAD binding subunit
MTGPGLVPSSVELAWPEHEGPGSVRGVFEGIEPGVAAQAERAAVGLCGAGLEPRIDQGIDDDTDQTEAETGRGGRIAMRVSHPPADLAAVLEEVWSASALHGFHAAITSHAAVGSTLVSLSPGQASPDGALAVQALRSIAVARGGSATVLEAPAAVGQAVDAWGPVGDAQDLMRRVKERFDPGRTLNPGRFVAGI